MTDSKSNFSLSNSRCFHHASREAAVCCPECRRFFCRECVSDFEERLLCDSCIRNFQEKKNNNSKSNKRFVSLLGIISGLFICVFTFYCLGQILFAIPNKFHDGSAWHAQEKK